MSRAEENRRSAGRWRRFSVRFLLAITACSAVLLGIWKAYYDVPETHQIPAYEKAPGTRALTARVGPNQIRIRSIARNRRDGNVELGAGPGLAQSRPFLNSDVIAASGPWLDVCQFELEPGTDRVEIIEARVFDHTTRTMLTGVSPAFGWQVVQPNLIQIYGLGEPIPPLLDVWLRVRSYEAGEHVSILSPQIGASVNLPAGTIAVSAMQRGFAGWSSAGGFYPVEEADTSETAMVLEWQGEWKERDKRYQIAAVTRTGEKLFEHRFGMPTYPTGGQHAILLFDLALEDIKHFELRPDGGRHRFFFEAVQLPPADTAPFALPPTTRVTVAQSEAELALDAWAPLRVVLSLFRGNPVSGSRASGQAAHLMMRPQPSDVESSLTVVYQVRGGPKVSFDTRFVDAESGNFIPQTAARARGGFQASAGTHHVGASSIELTVDRVEALDVSLIPPVANP